MNRDIFENLFVLEMTNNHQGNLERGLQIVREHSRAVRFNNVRAAIKLQFRDVDNFVHKDFRVIVVFPEAGLSQIPLPLRSRFAKFRLSCDHLLQARLAMRSRENHYSEPYPRMITGQTLYVNAGEYMT